MKILLIEIPNSGSRPGYSGLFLPLGLAYVTASLVGKSDYSFDCISLHTEEIFSKGEFNPWEQLNNYDFTSYDVVAYGGVFLKFEILKEISERVWSANKDIFQVAGGNMATTMADVILTQTKVTRICLYEGEQTFIELLSYLKNDGDWRNTRGIKYLNDQNELTLTAPREKIKDLDTVAYPDRENWSFDVIRKAFPFGSPGRYCAVVFASRGCPFSCTFCNPVSGKAIRARTSENIVSEIKHLKNKWNIQYFRFFDEVFIGSKRKIYNLCNLIIEEKLNIFWWCQTQIKLVDDELLKLMKKAGCIEIGYGIESGSNLILDEMRKGITKELAKDVIEMTERVGIKPSLNMISGSPSETYDTLKESRDFLISLNHINWVEIPEINFIVPIPGTVMYESAVSKGEIKDVEKYLKEDMSRLGKYTRTTNLTKMSDEIFFKSVMKFNEDVVNDFYKKHPWKKILSIIGLDHLRLDKLFSNFSLRQIRPLLESLAWATIGKRDNVLGKFIASIIYKRKSLSTGNGHLHDHYDEARQISSQDYLHDSQCLENTIKKQHIEAS